MKGPSAYEGAEAAKCFDASSGCLLVVVQPRHKERAEAGQGVSQYEAN